MKEQPATSDNRHGGWRGRLLVVGASGFLGSNVVATARDTADVVEHSSALVDLTVPGSATELVGTVAPDIVVNCAALADVDACERRPNEAQRLNAELPGELAAACAQRGAQLVHISTDAVFGARPGPYDLGTEPSPMNAYGRTKLVGEQLVLGAAPQSLVLRTNIVGWSPSGSRSLLEFFVNRLRAGDTVGGFTDVWFRPVAASDVWPIAAGLIDGGASGLVHLTGADLVSKYDFGTMVADRFGLDRSLVRPSSVADHGLAAARASRMDVLPSIESPPTIADTLERLHESETSWTS